MEPSVLLEPTAFGHSELLKVHLLTAGNKVMMRLGLFFLVGVVLSVVARNMWVQLLLAEQAKGLW